jgi:hypothetical protein
MEKKGGEGETKGEKKIKGINAKSIIMVSLNYKSLHIVSK